MYQPRPVARDPCPPRPRHVLRSDMDRRLGLTVRRRTALHEGRARIGPVGARPRGGSEIARATGGKLATRRVMPRAQARTLDATANSALPVRRRSWRFPSMRPTSEATSSSCTRPSIASAISTSSCSPSESSATSRERRSMPQPRSEIVQVNFTGVVSVTIPLVQRLEAQGHGSLVLLSSVAGERARRSNFVYGSSKAGADAFYQGLGDRRHRCARNGRAAGIRHHQDDRRIDPCAVDDTEAVADAIVRGTGTRSTTVWVPPALRFVMSGLRHLPRPVFRRLNI